MTIYCDDSGWGSLLGGVAIGLYNDENRKFLYHFLPVKLFQDKAFANKEYLDEALDSFVEMEARIGNYKKIEVCRGFILDRIWDHLMEFSECKKLVRTEIGNPLQGLLENVYANYLGDIGVPMKSGGAHCLSFDDQVKWIKQDPTRITYVKTGWPAWQKIKKKIKLNRKKK